MYLFTAFIERNNFNLWLHWTTWEPRENETVIDHEGVTIPINNEEPIICSAIRCQCYFYRDPQYRFQPPTIPLSPRQLPVYMPMTEEALPNSSINPAASTTRLYPASEYHLEPPEIETEPEEVLQQHHFPIHYNWTTQQRSPPCYHNSGTAAQTL